jgi:hypothetical protein
MPSVIVLYLVRNQDILCKMGDEIKEDEIGWPGSTYEMRSAQKILVTKPEGKGPFGRHRRRWEDFIKMDLRDIGLEGVEWIHLAQNRDQSQALVNTVMNFWVT